MPDHKIRPLKRDSANNVLEWKCVCGALFEDSLLARYHETGVTPVVSIEPVEPIVDVSTDSTPTTADLPDPGAIRKPGHTEDIESLSTDEDPTD